jgi:hypothetical protein
VSLLTCFLKGLAGSFASFLKRERKGKRRMADVVIALYLYMKKVLDVLPPSFLSLSFLLLN